MFVIVYNDNVYGPFQSEGDALNYAKYNWQGDWKIRPLIKSL